MNVTNISFFHVKGTPFSMFILEVELSQECLKILGKLKKQCSNNIQIPKQSGFNYLRAEGAYIYLAKGHLRCFHSIRNRLIRLKWKSQVIFGLSLFI